MSHILIVDDDPAVARVLAMMFERSGYRVDVANDGQEALERLGRIRADAMICDINMPRLSGRELCITLWRDGPYLPRCVCIVTSSTNLEERDWLDEMPGVELVEKPVSPRALLGRVGERLASLEGEKESAA